MALFTVGFLGGGILVVLATPDLLEDAAVDPVGAYLGTVLISGGILLILVLPSFYYLVRRARGIPVVTIDSRGVVLGGSWDDDLAVEWSNVRRIRLRQVTANGITDRQPDNPR